MTSGPKCASRLGVRAQRAALERARLIQRGEVLNCGAGRCHKADYGKNTAPVLNFFAEFFCQKDRAEARRLIQL